MYYKDLKQCSLDLKSSGLPVLIGTKHCSNALSFFRSKFFVPDQKFIYILWQSQTFCAQQKDDLHSAKLVFVPAQKFLKRH